MCFMGVLYEITSNAMGAFTPYLKHKYNIHNVYFTDAILKFVVIPFLYLLNDEKTKEIIYEENWYQGIRFVVGIYTKSLDNNKNNENSQNVVQERPQNIIDNRTRIHPSRQRTDVSSKAVDRKAQKYELQLVRSLSNPLINIHSTSTGNTLLKRCNSFDDNIVKTTGKTQNNLRPRSKLHHGSKVLHGSCSSLETLNIT